MDVIFDETVPPEEQYALVGNQYHSVDVNFKLLSRYMGEQALVLSASVPDAKYPDSGHIIELFYLFTYNKNLMTGENDCAFFYGQLVSFEDMEAYKVYEDDSYVCYDLSHMVYSDIDDYIALQVESGSNILWNEDVQARVENIYNYYKENLSQCFFYHQAG